MQALRAFFVPTGTLRPQPFVIAVIAIFLAGVASQLLTTPAIVLHGGLWLFAAVQALLVWVWLCANANRLRDAGRPIGLAVGAAVLYAFSIVLLVLIVMAAFAGTSPADVSDLSATGLVVIALLLSATGSLFGSPQAQDIGWLLTAAFTVAAFLPVIVVVAVSLWAATRPSARGLAA